MTLSAPTRALPPILLCFVTFALVAPLSTAEGQAPEVVAKIGDVEISKQELLEAASSKLRELDQQRHEILRQAIDQLVNQRLIERKATEQEQEVRAYIRAALEPAVSEPTEEDIKSFYDSVEDQLGGRTLEQVRPQIVRKLKNDQRQEAYDQLIERLRAESNVQILLEPYRVEISADDDPFVGPADAPVTIVEFSDYQCPYCHRAEKVVDQVLDHYDGKVRVVFRDMPLESLHPDAPKAHEAAGCALEQDQYWEMHDKLFANRQNLDRESLIEYAEELQLDAEAFETCLDEGQRAEEVAQDIAAARAQGISGTPAFFVNGRLLSGAQPFERFQEIIDDELRRAGVEPPSETP
jgi:protein-disulfide isomerase